MKFITKNHKKIPIGKVMVHIPEEVEPHRVTFHSPEVAERIVVGAGMAKQKVHRSTTRGGMKVITITSLRDKKIEDAKNVPYEEKKVEVKLAVITAIDSTNREIDSTGSKMIGGIDPLNKKGVNKMIDKSRKVGTLVGDLFD